MPTKAPRICSCGIRVAAGARCACQMQRKREHDAKRPSASERGYDGAWQKYRAAFLVKHPRCVRCDSAAHVVDHIKAPRGDSKLFWDKTNHQSLCTYHHNSWKQSVEKREHEQRRA